LLDDEDDYRILLSHHPNFYSEAADLGMDLMLSGHYHGGHVRLFDWNPAAWIDEKFAGGQSRIEDMELIVSRGAGSGLFPIRINCPAEIVAITLKKAA
jgi:predicted MPP superfamily phosphohydrolase